MGVEHITFAENLVYYLELNHMTQKDLATALGVSTGLVSDYCQGKKYPRVSRLGEIAEIFGIDKSYLIDDKRDVKTDVEKMAVAKYVGNDENMHRVIKSCKKLSPGSLKSLADFLESK